MRIHGITLLGLAVLLGIRVSSGQVAELSTEVCIVGGGSGGYSSAIAAARAGADCILVERQQILGGTSTAAYVSNWEPGPGDSIAREIYDRLRKLDAVGITSDHNADRRQGPFGLWLTTPGLSYEQTLRRSGLARTDWHGVVFDPYKLSAVVGEMLEETGKCRVMLGTQFTEVQCDGRRVVSIRAEADDGRAYRIRGRVFIDATGGAHLCRAAGFEMMLGPESKSRFGERSAPDEPETTLNAISLCYRIRKSDHPERQPAPDPPVENWPRSAHVTSVPGGGLIVNPLAMLPGRALLDLGYEGCMEQGRRIVAAQWRWLQENPAFADYEFDSFAPMLGIRESYRVVGEYVLVEQDLEAGLEGQNHADIIAIADHSMDVHGAGAQRVHGEMKRPYGVPYRCLIPKGSTNLLVACRGASFSHIAASSCRLSRTIIQLGHAAGTAAAMAVEADAAVGDVDVPALRKKLVVR
jgi:hypothetical protein